MLKLKAGTKVYINNLAIDMRKSINALSVLVQETLNLSPLSGHLFIFFNNRRDKVKILFWDKIGFVLYYKRMERHKFMVPKLTESGVMEITEIQLQGLLAGLDFDLMSAFPEISYTDLF